MEMITIPQAFLNIEHHDKQNNNSDSSFIWV
jgi:hypothetical protein